MARHVLLFATFSAVVMSCQETSSRPVVDEFSDATSTSDTRDLTNDAQVWVTVGQDAVPALTKALKLKGGPAAALGPSKNGATSLRLRESQLLTLAQVMHDQFHRCGGFEFHETEAQSLAALEPAVAPSAAAFTYTVDNGAVVNQLLPSLTASNVTATVTQLASYKNRYYNSDTGAAAAQWLKSQWATLGQGRPDVTVETFTHSWKQPSVILTITGQTLPNEVVVLGAHLDSINVSDTAGTAPGADDDASGIATLTEVIRAVLASGYHPARTVKFMGYAAEEVGLRGSSDIASKFKTNGVNVVGVMQLDMTNFHGSSSDIVVFTDYTDSSQNAFVSTLIDTYVKVTRSTSSCGYACSDHASWNSSGYRTSMPFESLMSDYNPNIHTEDDTLANSGGNVDHSMKFAKLATAFVAELGKGGFGTSTDSTPPTVAITSPKSGATLSGTVTIPAPASDNTAVARVDFTIDGALAGSDSTAPYTFEWNTTTVPNGAWHTISAQAYDAAGNSASTRDSRATVSNTGSATAAYDSTRKAPTCAVSSPGCDSGTLLVGRGSLGPEVNKPNTLNGSCNDGASGSFHGDESVDRLVVSSTDGQPLRAGASAKLEATVWAYSGFTNDKVDLYFTADATAASPKWVLISTLTPTAAGAQTLSATAALGSLTLRARRLTRAKFDPVDLGYCVSRHDRPGSDVDGDAGDGGAAR